MVNIRRLWEGLHGHEIIEDYDTPPIVSRPDLPVIYPGGRGSIKRALDLTVTDRDQSLIARLEDDMYAQSSKKPREALWKTWCSMASAWNLPPVPLTEELVVKVGASFKAGHYKSPQNYFSRALQEHRQLTKQHPTPFVQSLIKNVIRSITRGTGPTAFKDSFEVELLNRAYDLNSLRREPHHWSEDPSHSRDATLICCWWLLRGIEAAAASTKHVWRQNTRDERTTFITLPVQKNDTTGCLSGTLLLVPDSTTPPSSMPTPRDDQTPCDPTPLVPNTDWPPHRHASDTRPRRANHLPDPNRADLPRNHPEDRHHYGETRSLRRTTTSVLPTFLPSLRSSVSHTTGILSRGSPIDWKVGIRRHQAIHPRSSIAATTHSQPTVTTIIRDQQPTAPEHGTEGSTSTTTPILGRQSHD